MNLLQLAVANVTFCRRFAPLFLTTLLCACAGQERSLPRASTPAAIAFSGVAAGDMGTSDAILWTRAFDPATGQPLKVAVTAQLADEREFRKIRSTFKGTTDAERAGTVKIQATGLRSHTRYFYRFVADDGAFS